MHIREYLAALALVNEERQRAGLPRVDHLPAGVPGDSARCAIAKAIPGAHVTDVLRAGSTVRELPGEVRQFIQSFDRSGRRESVDPGTLVDGGIEDDKGSLVLA